MGKTLVSIFVVLLALFAPFEGISNSEARAAKESWLAGWDYRIKITVDHTRIQATLFDFPLLIHLSSSSGISGADVSSIFTILGSYDNRRKITLTTEDGVTQLYVEIEEWDTFKKEAFLWVKVPILSTSADTILYLYYDNTQVDNNDMVGDSGSVAAEKVWDSNFVMVQHLKRSRNLTPGIFRDSAAHHNNALAGPNPSQLFTTSDWTTFDGSEYLEVPDNDDFSVTTTGELTISLWLSPSTLNFDSSTDGYINFMGKGDIGQYEWSFVFYSRDSQRPQRISFYLDNLQGGAGSGSYTQEPIKENEWVYITAKVDSQQTYIYRNGKFVRADFYKGPDAFAEIYPENGTEPIRIGTRNMKNWFEGRIREVRISNVSRQDSWITASYYSESDSLVYLTPFKNEPPEISLSGGKTVRVGNNLSLYVSAVSPDGKPVTYSAFNLPEGASFDPSTHIFSWTPEPNQAGPHHIQFKASDGIMSASEDVTITVIYEPPLSTPATQPPTLPAEPGKYPSSGLPVGSIIFGAGILVAAVVPVIVFTRRRLRRNNWSSSSFQRKMKEDL